MEEFWHKQKMKLYYKSDFSDGEKGCIMWTGARYASGYGYTDVKWPSGEKTRERIHRFSYMVYYKKTKDEIPKYGGPDELECSHLCGNKCCINAEHLVFEKHDINQERIHCRNQGLCCKCHKPYCIL